MSVVAVECYTWVPLFALVLLGFVEIVFVVLTFEFVFVIVFVFVVLVIVVGLVQL